MLGLLVASIASGRAISRIGRYRIFPIAGTAILVVGMFLLSRLGVGTAPWLASVYMLVVGIGIGLVMQVLVLVVQNDAASGEHRRRDLDRDVLPLGRRLLRRRDLRHDLRRRGSPTRSRTSRAPSSRSSAAASSSARPPPSSCRLTVHADFLQAFSHSLHGVFLWGMAIAVIPFALSWLLKEVPLRTTLHRSAELSVEEAAAGGAVPEQIVEPLEKTPVR